MGVVSPAIIANTALHIGQLAKDRPKTEPAPASLMPKLYFSRTVFYTPLLQSLPDKSVVAEKFPNYLFMYFLPGGLFR